LNEVREIPANFEGAKMNNSNNDTLAILLARRPRPAVAELVRHTDVLRDETSVWTYMPWIATVSMRTSDSLARAMLTQAVLHGGEFGVRNTYCVAFWREPLVRRVFTRAQLLQLCRKWAAAYPYEMLGDYRRLAIALGQYDQPDRGAKASADELALLGHADAAKIMAVVARNLGDWLRLEHLELLLTCNLSVATLCKAALRVNYGTGATLLQGYVLAQPGLSRKDSSMLMDRLREQFTALRTESPGAANEVFELLLKGITRATGRTQHERVRGLAELRNHLHPLER
jgi:hypothetical protein